MIFHLALNQKACITQFFITLINAHERSNLKRKKVYSGLQFMRCTDQDWVTPLVQTPDKGEKLQMKNYTSQEAQSYREHTHSAYKTNSLLRITFRSQGLNDLENTHNGHLPDAIITSSLHS